MTIEENAIYLAHPDIAVDKIAALEKEIKELKALISIQNFLNGEIQKDQDGFVEIVTPCTEKDRNECISFPDRCESSDGVCRLKINLNKLCKC